MKKRLHVRGVLFIATLYSVAILTLVAKELSGLIVLFLAYAAVCASITGSVIRDDLRTESRETTTFKRDLPLRSFGSILLSFQHVFSHGDSIVHSLRQEIGCNLCSKNALPSLTKNTFIDTDKNLFSPEARTFFITTSKPTPRGETTLTFVVHLKELGSMQSIEWWVLAGGFIDPNRIFFKIALSPLTIHFWFRSHLKGEYDIRADLLTTYSSFFNTRDYETQARFIHATVYNTLVDVLDGYEIDTSELKLGRSQNLNVQISGGRAQFGDIIQGAMNKIMPSKKE